MNIEYVFKLKISIKPFREIKKKSHNDGCLCMKQANNIKKGYKVDKEVSDRGRPSNYAVQTKSSSLFFTVMVKFDKINTAIVLVIEIVFARPT